MKSTNNSKRISCESEVNVASAEAPDALQALSPPNETPVELATSRMETTLCNREEPNWTSCDFERVAEAARLCDDPEAGIRRGLKRRFLNACGRLAASTRLNNAEGMWMGFGEKVRRVSPVFDVKFTVERAITFLVTRLQGKASTEEARITEEACLIELAREIIARFGHEIPENLRMLFRDSMSTNEFAVREHFNDPNWIAVARSLQLPLPSSDWVLDVLSATAVMDDLPNPECSSRWFTERHLQIEHVSRVMKQYNSLQRPGPYYLPYGYFMALHQGALRLAAAITITEKPSPHLLQLCRALRIDRCDSGGYTFGGTQVCENCPSDHLQNTSRDLTDAELLDEVLEEAIDDHDLACFQSCTLKIEDAVRKDELLGWSRHDFDTLVTARELYAQLDVRIHRDLMHRFQSVLVALVYHAIRRGDDAEWASFRSELLKALPTETAVVLIVGTATKLLQRMIDTRDAGWWGGEEMMSLFKAVGLVDLGALKMPGMVTADFRLCWIAFAEFVRHKHAEPAIRSFVAMLRERIAVHSPNSAFLL